MFRIALLDDYQEVALRMADWASLAPRAEATAFADHLTDVDALADRLAPFDAVMLMRERTAFPRALIERLPKLRLLLTSGMWNVAIDIDAATERGILVCGTRDLSNATAELTLGLMLALARHIHDQSRVVRDGGWQTTVGTGLADRTLGIVGLGNLGVQVAGFAHAFNMDVMAWSPNLTAERAAAAGARLVGKDELFVAADFVTVHVKLSERSRGLVGAAELARMRPTAYLINTSRGPIVDEAALVAALRERRIAGAGLDVFDVEPLPPGHPFRCLDNVLALPHVGYVIEENYRVFYGDVLEDIRGFLDGTPVRPLNAV